MAKHYPILLKRVLLPFLGALVALVSVTCSQGKPAARRTQKPLQSAQDAVAKPPSEELRTEQVENTKIGLSPFFDYIPQRERVLVLYTASVQGYVEPCGCTGEPLGGIARWAAAVDQARAAYGNRLLILDGGDLLFEKLDDDDPIDACQTKARHDTLLSTYQRKGVVATALGPRDLVRGVQWRNDVFRDLSLTTVDMHYLDEVRAKVPHQEDIEPPPQAYLLKDLDGLLVGVTGIGVLAENPQEPSRERLRAVVDVMREKGARIVIAISQVPRRLTETIGENVEGLDLIIQGRDPGELPVAPKRLGTRGPVLSAAGMQSQHLGSVEIDITGRTDTSPLLLDDRAGQKARRRHLLEARIKQYTARINDADEGPRRDFLIQKRDKAIAEKQTLTEQAGGMEPAPAEPHLTVRTLTLSRARPEEAKAKAALEAYETSIPTLTAQCEANATCPEPAMGEPVFVGVQACYGCHQDAVKFWQTQIVSVEEKDAYGKKRTRRLGHAKAWETLEKAGKTQDRTCVGCHSIGFNVAGGYCRVNEVDFRKNVQCESCHGPGSLHIQNGGDPSSLGNPIVDEQVCRTCHHVPHIPTTESFVFEEKLRHILGPGHGENRLQQLGGQTIQHGK